MAKETIQGVDFIYPDVPDRRDIANHSLAVNKQKFIRPDYEELFDDLEFDANGDPILTSDQEAFVLSELEKIENGYWFFNNGKVTYITGLHYFYLVYWTLEDGSKPDYRDVDRRWFYFYYACRKLSYVYGIIRVKKRREGATSQEACALVYQSMMNRRSFCGIVSKTGEDAQDVFIDMVMNGLRNLPPFLKPWIDDEEARTQVEFVKRMTVKDKKNKTKGNVKSIYRGLESKISWKNTALNSYDSGRKTEVLLDESGKFEKVPIHVYWSILKKTMGIGATKVGFAVLPSTINPAKKGGENFKKIWNESSQYESKVTASGLYQYFVPADDGYPGFIDDYGMSMSGELSPSQKKKIIDIVGEDWPGNTCASYIRHKRSKIKDIETLQEEIRMEPLDLREAFNFGDVDAFLDVENILNQKQVVQDMIHEKKLHIRTVTFFRKDSGDVDWIDDAKGIWQVLKFPPKDKCNQSDIDIIGRKKPKFQGMRMSVDPIRNVDVGKYGSKASAVVGEMLDDLDPENTGMPIIFMKSRLKFKKPLYEQIFLCAEYVGAMVCFESDINDYLEYAMEWGYMGYVLKRPKSTIAPDRKRKPTGIEYGTPSNDSFSFAKQNELLKEYFKYHCHKIFFLELLEDAETFDPEDRRKSDGTVGLGIWLTAIAKPAVHKKPENVKKSTILPTFDLTKQFH